MKRPHLINIIQSKIKKFAPEVKSILYGSEARGEAREDSDIDILILLPDRYEGKEFVKRKLAISGMLYDLSLDLNVEISPLILVPKIFYRYPTPLTLAILQEGIEL